MKLLVAKNDNGRFTRVGTVQLTKDGSRVVRVPKAIQPGSLVYHFARQAGRFFSAETAAVDIDYEFGTQKYRVSKIG
jgi:hypothetical protein